MALGTGPEHEEPREREIRWCQRQNGRQKKPRKKSPRLWEPFCFFSFAVLNLIFQRGKFRLLITLGILKVPIEIGIQLSSGKFLSHFSPIWF